MLITPNSQEVFCKPDVKQDLTATEKDYIDKKKKKESQSQLRTMEIVVYTLSFISTPLQLINFDFNSCHDRLFCPLVRKYCDRNLKCWERKSRSYTKSCDVIFLQIFACNELSRRGQSQCLKSFNIIDCNRLFQIKLADLSRLLFASANTIQL